jgi:FKBP-type peptidyl-prolyl cis-trans isomerase 2
MADPAPSRTFVILLVVVVIAAGAGGAGFLYYETHKGGSSARPTVQIGDNVTVNYIGVFGSSPQIGRVFDSSFYSVATNNYSWPKSLGYTPRGWSPSNYTPLPVSVGPDIPQGGYTVGNLTFEGVVTGFWQGLVGLPGNETHYIVVPPSLGYGNQNSSCLRTQTLSFTVPAVATLSRSAFSAQFPNAPILTGTEFKDPTYGWTDYIASVNATSVTYQSLATVGWTSAPQGWPVVVTNVSATTLTLTNQLSASNAGLVGGTVSGSGVCGSTSFVVSQVNPASSTYVENFNSQVSGQTLIFIVTVVDIFPPAPT